MASVDLDQLQRMWQEDAKVDDINLDKEALNVPNLHAKYLTILSTAKLNLQKERSDYYKLRRFKWRYYRGELSQQELTELGWDQWLGSKPLKNEMDEQLEGDFDLIKKKDKIAYWETVVDTLERIMRSIGSRGFDIKHAIEWHKFTNGVM